MEVLTFVTQLNRIPSPCQLAMQTFCKLGPASASWGAESQSFLFSEWGREFSQGLFKFDLCLDEKRHLVDLVLFYLLGVWIGWLGMDLIVEVCLREGWQLGSAEEEKEEPPESW